MGRFAELSTDDTGATSSSMGNVPIIHMPVRGTWKLVKSPGHERYAFDLLAADVADGRSLRFLKTSRLQHILGRASADDWYGWSRPVYAPTDGVVVHANDGGLDRQQLSLFRDLWTVIFSRPRLDPDDISPFAGNHVILQADGQGDEDDGFYVFLAHLQSGSVQVAEEGPVAAGQLIGRVGNSGFTLEPHLHVQLLDRVDSFLAATAPPFLIHEYERWTGGEWEVVKNSGLRKGDLVRAVSNADDAQGNDPSYSTDSRG